MLLIKPSNSNHMDSFRSKGTWSCWQRGVLSRRFVLVISVTSSFPLKFSLNNSSSEQPARVWSEVNSNLAL